MAAKYKIKSKVKTGNNFQFEIEIPKILKLKFNKDMTQNEIDIEVAQFLLKEIALKEKLIELLETRKAIL